MSTSGSRYRERVQGSPDKAPSDVRLIAFAKMLIHGNFSVILMIACKDFESNMSMEPAKELMGKPVQYRKLLLVFSDLLAKVVYWPRALGLALHCTDEQGNGVKSCKRKECQI